ncbi:hypothetical protein BKA64DRAFT_78193 [Cadophora sp. MPI-SDFR-AT-0126]|nr:hypothetical protein BKA64DRAFT_78193 [Leotiomycetes sp. MPI-SDFR-AT-0126]
MAPASSGGKPTHRYFFCYISVLLPLSSFLPATKLRNPNPIRTAKMSSYTAAPMGNPETLNDASAAEEPQVQSDSIYTADEGGHATECNLAEQYSDLDAIQTRFNLDVTSAWEFDQEEPAHEASDTSTSAADCSPDSDGVDSPSTPYESDEEPDSPTDEANENFSQNVNPGSSQNGTGKVHTHQNISDHTAQILDAYFRNDDVICNFEDSLVEDWVNFESLASQDELWQILRSSTVNSQVTYQSAQLPPISQRQELSEASQLDVTDDSEGFQSFQHTEHYFEQNHQPATYYPQYQSSNDLYDAEGHFQPDSCLLGSQQQSGHYYVPNYQPAAYSPGSYQKEELRFDENDGQRTSRIPTIKFGDELYDNEFDLQTGYYHPKRQQDFEHYNVRSHQPTTYSSGSQQYDGDAYYDETDPQQASYVLEAHQYDDEVYYDETDLQQPLYVPTNQQRSQFYPEQSASHALTQHQTQTQTHSKSYHRQIFEEKSFIPGDDTSNTGFNTEDPTGVFDNDDDDATVDEDEPEVPALSIDERLAELEKQIALAQANTQATLDKISQNEKRIQEIGATLKQKRKRTDNLDESEELPVKKTKTPAYRRPSTRKDPKAKAAKGKKKSLTAGTPIKFVQYVPEGEVQNANSPNAIGSAQGLGIQFYPPESQPENSYSFNAPGRAQVTESQFEWFDEPAYQVQNTSQPDASFYSQNEESQFESFEQSSHQVQDKYQPDTSSYNEHVGSQFNQSSPATSHLQNADTPNDFSYSQAQDFQGQDIEVLLSQLDHQQYSTGNYGMHAAQAMAANGYHQFPFGIPSDGSVRWDGY